MLLTIAPMGALAAPVLVADTQNLRQIITDNPGADIQLGAGVHVLTAGSEIVLQENTRILGGPGVIVDAGNLTIGTGGGVFYSRANNVEFHNFTIRNAPATGPVLRIGGGFPQNTATSRTSGIVVNNITFENGGRHFIDVNGVSGITITGSTFGNLSVGHAIHVANSDNVNIINCTFLPDSIGWWGAPIALTASNLYGATISDITVSGGTLPVPAVVVTDPHPTNHPDAVIHFNTFDIDGAEFVLEVTGGRLLFPTRAAAEAYNNAVFGGDGTVRAVAPIINFRFYEVPDNWGAWPGPWVAQRSLDMDEFFGLNFFVTDYQDILATDGQVMVAEVSGTPSVGAGFHIELYTTSPPAALAPGWIDLTHPATFGQIGSTGSAGAATGGWMTTNGPRLRFSGDTPGDYEITFTLFNAPGRIEGLMYPIASNTVIITVLGPDTPQPPGDGGFRPPTINQPPTQPGVYTYVYHDAYMFGNERGQFRPHANITRAEVAAILVRTMVPNFRQGTYPASTAGLASFSDVTPANWFYWYVVWAQSVGLIQGNEDGTFRPNAPITRQEYAAMVARTGNVRPAGNLTFADAGAIGNWARNYVYTAVRNGWMLGGTGNFRPTDNITRAEIATATNRILGRVDSQSALAGINLYNPVDVRRFPDVSSGAWYFASVLGAANDHRNRMDGAGAIVWKEVLVDG